MPPQKRRTDYYQSETGLNVEHLLKQMVSDKSFNTKSGYSANAIAYPDNLEPFVTKHMNYLCSHPSIDPQHYLANLRLITRIR